MWCDLLMHIFHVGRLYFEQRNYSYSSLSVIIRLWWTLFFVKARPGTFSWFFRCSHNNAVGTVCALQVPSGFTWVWEIGCIFTHTLTGNGLVFVTVSVFRSCLLWFFCRLFFSSVLFLFLMWHMWQVSFKEQTLTTLDCQMISGLLW